MFREEYEWAKKRWERGECGGEAREIGRRDIYEEGMGTERLQRDLLG